MSDTITSETSGSTASQGAFSPDLTPVSDLDPAELVRRLTARVYALWWIEARIERERRWACTGGRTNTPGGRIWRR